MKYKTLSILVLSLVLIWGVPSVFGAIPDKASTGIGLVEERIDDMLSSLEETMEVDENFKETSGLSALFRDLVDPNGAYQGTSLDEWIGRVGALSAEQDQQESKEKMNTALNQAIRFILQELLENEDLDGETQEVLIALLGMIDPDLIEEYSEPGSGGPVELAHGRGGGPDDRDRRDRENRFETNEQPQEVQETPTPTAPTGFRPPDEHLNYTPNPPGDPVDPGDWQGSAGASGNPDDGFVQEPPDPGFTFPFFGKTYNSPFVGTDGFITFVEGNDDYLPGNPDDPPNPQLGSFKGGPPRIAALWTDLTADTSVAPGAQIKIETSNSYYRVSWDNVKYYTKPERASFAATLYENGWIAFSYGDMGLVNNHPLTTKPFPPPLDDGFYALVGLSPGDGTDPNHPGFGETRTWASIDLSSTGGAYDYVNYEGIFEWWRDLDGLHDGHAFDLANSYLIFRPGSPKYAVLSGSKKMVVAEQSLNDAIIQMMQDPVSMAAAEDGVFLPGDLITEGATDGFPGRWTGYGYGLQVVGRDEEGRPKAYLRQETLERINRSGFMAYAVQVEEDLVNRKILEMHRERVNQSLRQDIRHALEYGDIRTRDDLLTRKADAQAGRVLRDREGNLVRVQQYVLRPDDNSVQVLNVSLRDGAGDLAGMSTIDWQTRFTENINGVNLKELAWSRWLDTQHDGVNRYVLTTATAPQLSDMSVQFTNPADESLREARWFDGRMMVGNQPRQNMNKEQLTLVSQNLSGTFDYTRNPLTDGQYQVIQNEMGAGTNPRGFHYVLRNGGRDRTINVAFFVLGDGVSPENTGISTQDYSHIGFKDIWDALRVNETGAPNIGSNNLEIAIDPEKGVFTKPVDVVYIPMSRMLWR